MPIPQLIDTHAHIYSTSLLDVPYWQEESKNGGVQNIIMPNIDLSSMEPMILMERSLQGLAYSSIGLHPCHVFEDFEDVLKQLEGKLETHNWIAIGETGLDYFHDLAFIREQKTALEIQLNWAKSTGLPIILHTRDALSETIEIVKSHQDGRLSGVFHCFSGSAEEAKMIQDLGFMIGIGGVMTYPKARMYHLCQGYPNEIIVLETDAPYLPPVPHRGKINHPGYLPIIAQALADAKKVTLAEIAATTTLNAKKLFKLCD